MSFTVSGLIPEQKYCFSLEMVPMDSHRYKYLNSKWIQVGKADTHSSDKMKHDHPDNPNTGKFWMRQKVSFKKVKLTNNKTNKHNHVSPTFDCKCKVAFSTSIVFSSLPLSSYLFTPTACVEFHASLPTKDPHYEVYL